MELCSLFQDLTYSLEIAAHDAGLEHYAPHMDFDAVTAVQRYHECFVPEHWTPPFAIHAEVEFALSALDTARSQMSERAIMESLGVMIEAGDQFAPLVVRLVIQFVLKVSALAPPSEAWQAYCYRVAGRDSLQAGLENLRRRLQRAIGDEPHRPPLLLEARTTLSAAGPLTLRELVGSWETLIDASSGDEARQERLENIMNRIRAGLEAMEEFAQDIQQDFAGHLQASF